MAHAYLTKKQMPWSYWFYALVHSARMMNAIPGKLGGKLASPFLLAHGVGHDERTWFLSFQSVIFTMSGMATSLNPTANHIQWMALLLVTPLHRMLCWCTVLGESVTTSPTPIAWTLINFPPWCTLLFVMMEVSFAPCYEMKMSPWKNSTPRVHELNGSILPQTCFWRVR